MSQYFEIHPDNPQVRLIHQAVEIIRRGGVIAYPTDSSYALGCQLDDKKAVERIQSIRRLDKKHHFTLMCSELSQISSYSKLDNTSYRFIKSHTPGPYTFILPATSEVPRMLKSKSKKTIGIRVPDNQIALDLLSSLGEPLMTTTLIMPDTDMPLTDPYKIRVLLEHEIDLVIDGGFCDMDLTTVLDMSQGFPHVVRQGLGSIDWLEKH